jgi:hypothetical protein
MILHELLHGFTIKFNLLGQPSGQQSPLLWQRISQAQLPGPFPTRQAPGSVRLQQPVMPMCAHIGGAAE